MYYDCTNSILKRNQYIEKIHYGEIIKKGDSVLDMYLICQVKGYHQDEAVRIGRYWLDFNEGEFYTKECKTKNYKNFKSWIDAIWTYNETLSVGGYFESIKLNKQFKKGV